MVIVPDHMKLDDLRHEFPGVFASTRYADAGAGWLPTVRQFVGNAQRAWRNIIVEGLRRKWGVLQIDMARVPAAADDEVALAVALAEMRSLHRCECCGAPGFIRIPVDRRHEWICCRCDEHATERQRSRPRPAMYDRREIRVGGIIYRYDVDDDCLELVDPPLDTPPTEWRYPR